MKSQIVRFFPLFCAAAFLLVLSCKAAPPAQEDLDRLNAAMIRAQTARQAAAEVQGEVYFPDEWKKAEADNDAGRNAEKDTLVKVNEAIAWLTSAAEAYDEIAEKSGPLYAQDLENARTALEEAMARAEEARKNAQDNGAETYFPDEWQNAETGLQAAKDAKTETLNEIKEAAAQFVSAAGMYDDIAEKSAPLLAQDNAKKALEAAAARAELSRQQAADVNGQTFFQNDWRAAEAALQAAKDAGIDTTEEINAAAAQFAAAADAYDSIAAKSGPMFARERDDAARALQAAIARAEQSRRQVSGANGQNNFPNEWRDAEAKNQAAQNAARATAAEMRAATPLYTTAADAYDNIGRLNAARQAEQARLAAEQARQAEQARLAAEQARAAEEARRNMNNAKTQADRARQAAMDARANIAAQADFNAADGIYRQAVTSSSNANSVAAATDGFNRAAAQFTAVATATTTKRRQTEEVIVRARDRRAGSVAHATNIGRIMDGEIDENTGEGNE